MKRFLTMIGLLSLALAFVTVSASAEKSSYLGSKGGLNLAKVSTDGFDFDGVVIENLTSRTGLVAGAFGSFGIAENLSIQTEVLFSQKGAKFDTSMTVQGITADVELLFKLDYIEVPVLLKYSIPVQGSIRPNLFCGPALAIKSVSKLKVTASALGQSASETIDIEDVKSTDFGVVFGGGLDIVVGNGRIVLDGRYTLGMSSIDDSSDNEDIKNRAISVTAGYAFPIGQ